MNRGEVLEHLQAVAIEWVWVAQWAQESRRILEDKNVDEEKLLEKIQAAMEVSWNASSRLVAASNAITRGSL
ncbi:hypothetical protein D3C87_1173980 [compost metagenome]